MKLERDPAAKMTPAAAEVKPEWDKWRAEPRPSSEAMTAARAAVAAATGPAEASLTQPGQPAFDAEQVPGRHGQQGRRGQRRRSSSPTARRAEKDSS